MRRPGRHALAAAVAVLTVGGSVASAQVGDPTQTVTIQVEAARTISLSTDTVTGTALRPTDSATYTAGTVTYGTDTPGEDYLVASASADLANPSSDVTLAVSATGITCSCSSPGVQVDGDLLTTPAKEPVVLGPISTAIITGISDTGETTAQATLAYLVSSSAALPGQYQYTVTYLLTGA